MLGQSAAVYRLPPHNVSVGSYAALGPASVVSGIIVAQSYVALTGCVLNGAALSLHAAVSIVESSVSLPTLDILAISGPAYNTPVSLGSAASFVVRRRRCL